MTTHSKLAGKPIPLRAIFILNLTLAILAYSMFAVISVKGLNPGVPANWILFTAMGYTVSFGTLVWAILNRNITVARTVLVCTFAMSFPASAYIGFFVSVVSLGLTFHPKVKHYFQQ
jgi:hypothetical protein